MGLQEPKTWGRCRPGLLTAAFLSTFPPTQPFSPPLRSPLPHLITNSGEFNALSHLSSFPFPAETWTLPPRILQFTPEIRLLDLQSPDDVHCPNFNDPSDIDAKLLLCAEVGRKAHREDMSSNHGRIIEGISILQHPSAASMWRTIVSSSCRPGHALQ